MERCTLCPWELCPTPSTPRSRSEPTTSSAKAFQAACIKGIVVKGEADISRNKLDTLTDMCKQWGAKGLAWFRVRENELEGQLTKFLGEQEQKRAFARRAQGGKPSARRNGKRNGRPSPRASTPGGEP